MLKLAISRLYLKKAISSRSFQPEQAKTFLQLENIKQLAQKRAQELAKQRQQLSLSQKLTGKARILDKQVEESHELAQTAHKFSDRGLWSRWYGGYPSKFHKAGIGAWKL